VRSDTEDGLADAIRKALQDVLTGEISVTVKNKNKKTVSDARVIVSGLEIEEQTDLYGTCLLRGVPIGKRIVEVTHPRYENGSTSTQVLFSSEVPLTFTLPLKPGTIKGAVRIHYKERGTDELAEGARVVLTKLPVDLNAPRDFATGREGSYEFRDLEPGDYRVQAAFPPSTSQGCWTRPQRKVVTLEGGELTVNFSLDCDPNPSNKDGGLTGEGNDPVAP
jgi:hypothetical protein